MSWVDELKAGSVVLIVGLGPSELRTVTRVTKTQVVTGGKKWSKRTLRRVGSRDSWGGEIGQITEATPERIKEVESRYLQDRLHELCAGVTTRVYTDDSMRAIIEAFENATWSRRR